MTSMIEKVAATFERIPELQGPALRQDRLNMASAVIEAIQEGGVWFENILGERYVISDKLVIDHILRGDTHDQE